LVHARATANHLLLGQVAVDQKSNAITAIPKLLKVLEVSRAIVTIDAMGCQKEVARLPGRRGRVLDPRPPLGPAVPRRHGGRDPRLVHENKPPGLDPFDLAAELSALPPDLRAVPLGGVRGLLLDGDVELLQGPPDEHDAAAEAEPLLEHLE